MAGYQNLYLNQGESFSTEINLSDQNGAPYNLNGFTILSNAKKSYYSNTIILAFDTSSSNANNGTITLTANSYITSNVSSGILVYDVILVDSFSNNVTRVLEGQIYVSPGVTFF